MKTLSTKSLPLCSPSNSLPLNSSFFSFSSLKQEEEENAKDRYISLDTAAESEEAYTLANSLASTIKAALDKPYAPRRLFVFAVGVVIADLLITAKKNTSRYGFRRVKPENFTGLAVGYRNFIEIMTGLELAGLIDREVGHHHSATKDGRGVATRFRATTKLLELALQHGITPGNWRSHFQPLPRPRIVKHPIMRRTSSERYNGRKLPGKAMEVDYSLPRVKAKADQVNAINTFMVDQDLGLGNYRHRGFHRMFNQGDLEAFDWDLGGRLYSLGDDSYQAAPQEERKAFTINGEAVVEIDLRASHLTILHALKGVPMDVTKDPYTMPPLPRPVVKAWMTMTLGHTGFHRGWTAEALKKADKRLARGEGPDLRLYRFEDVQKRVLAELPIFADWPDSDIRWGTLQYKESCAIVDAVYELATTYAVVALPVHDSLIVPASKQELATKVLATCFYQHIGAWPAVSTK